MMGRPLRPSLTAGPLHERGSMVPLFGGLVVVSFVMIALVVELALLGATYRSLASTADPLLRRVRR